MSTEDRDEFISIAGDEISIRTRNHGYILVRTNHKSGRGVAIPTEAVCTVEAGGQYYYAADDIHDMIMGLLQVEQVLRTKSEENRRVAAPSEN